MAIVLLVGACGGNSVPGDDVDAGQLADARVALPDANEPTPDAMPSGPCDPIAQTGCTDNQKCSIIPDVDSANPPTVGCVANVGAGILYQSCTRATATTPDDCGRGTACVGSIAPRCLEFCSGEPSDTCSGEQSCAVPIDFDGDFQADVEFCAEQCDPLAQDCTGTQDACYPSRQDALCFVEGAGGTPVAEGGSCTFANSCAAGHGCFRLGISPDWLCFQLCNPLGGAPACGAGKLCSTVENETWGICIDPF